MKEKLKELNLLEHDWLDEKSKKFITNPNHEINNENEILKNLKQYKNTKVQFIKEVNKLLGMQNNYNDLKNRKYLKKVVNFKIYKLYNFKKFRRIR